MRRYWQASPPARWLRALWALAHGARVHPGATVYGGREQVAIGGGARVGAGCVLRPTGGGRIELGERTWLARGVEIETDTLVRLGPRTTVQRRCTVNGSTRIGADCILAPDVFISSGTHPFRHLPHLPIREQERRLAAAGVSADRPVWIQDDCWLGTHVVVSPGVTVGKGSVIGANSVVTRDVPPYAVVAGAPARVIGRRLAWEPPARLDATRATDWPYFLSGTLQDLSGDSATGLRITPGEPLLVALRLDDPARMVRIRLHCATGTQLRVNGQAVAVAPHATELLLQAAPHEEMGATLRIEATEHGADLVFASFECPRPASA